MDRQEIEHALMQLEALLVNLDCSEQDFQDWFENHPVIFAAYGYQRHVAHPRLLDGDKLYIPDFICQRLDNTWEVVELKRPDTRVLRDSARRHKFYADLESYYSQCRESCEFFEQDRNREYFNKTFDTVVQMDVPAVLIAGRTESIDRVKVHRILADRGSKVAHHTFDDVRNTLEFYRARLFSKYENNTGISIHWLGVPFKVEVGMNHLLDFGVKRESNRISIVIDGEDRLSFEIRDVNGQLYTNRAPLEKLGIRYGSMTYLAFELGLGEDYSFLSVEGNGCVFEDRRLDGFEMDVSAGKEFVIGADVLGEGETAMDVIEYVFRDQTLSFREKVEVREYMLGQCDYVVNNPGVAVPRLKFRRNQFMHSSQHPNFRGRNWEDTGKE